MNTSWVTQNFLRIEEKYAREDLRKTSYYHYPPRILKEHLVAVKEKYGNKPTYLELGSGLSFNMVLAANLGFDAYGVEINPFLVKESRKIIKKAKKDGFYNGEVCKVIQGSYLPKKFAQFREENNSISTKYEQDALEQFVWIEQAYVNHSIPKIDVYQKNKIKFEDFDVFFAYCFGTQVPAFAEMFSEFAKDDATLLYSGYGEPWNIDELFYTLGLKREQLSIRARDFDESSLYRLNKITKQ